jgi:phospholipid/cholesterol/gamma-HCH transport system substrate-binding protein
VNETTRREIWIGLLVLAGLAMVGGMFWILENQAFQKRYLVGADFTYAGGIREGTPVHMAGKPIGQVKVVNFREVDLPAEDGKPSRREVRVDVVLEIEADYKIKKDAKLTVGSMGLLGEKIIEFSLGSAEAEYLPIDGTARMSGEVPPGLEALQKSIEVAVADVRVTITKVNQLLDNLNDPELQGGLKGTVKGLDAAAGKVAGTIEKVDGFVTKADEFVGKAGEAMDEVNRILKAAEEVVKKVDEVGAKLSTLVDDLKTEVTATAESVRELSASLEENSKKLNETLETVNGLLADVKAGKGSLGALFTDKSTARKLDELLVSLKSTSDSLAATSDMLRRQPDALIWGKDDDEEPSPPAIDWRDRK